MNKPHTTQDTRRGFLIHSVAAMPALAAIGSRAFIAADETIRVGLVGCGGRGTGAAVNALTADSRARLIAMGDVFEDHLQISHQQLQASKVNAQVAVDPAMRFSGFDAYRKVIENVDVVLLATPPHFRPMQMRAAVEAGRHVFAEKPVAVDAPGVRSVLESGRMAAAKGLTVVSGLGWRYEPSMRQTIERLHDGAVGEIHTVQTMRMGGGLWVKPRQPRQTDMEYQLRNWYYYTWLSGDFIAEQFVHELDKVAWVMRDVPPIRCVANGGRQSRTGSEFGHIYDHFSCVYEYENGSRAFAFTRQQNNCSHVGGDTVLGTEGRADLTSFTIKGPNPWSLKARMADVYLLEHQAMFDSIRGGATVNNTQYMAQSTMLAIMARMSAYTGQIVSWDQAMNSTQDLSPPGYDWQTPLPEPDVAVPGITKFL